MTQQQRRQVGFRPALWFAFGLGTGYVPKAPGTAGTLAAVPLVVFIVQVHAALQLVIWVTLFALGCWMCQIAADWLEERDPGAIVWDEIVGFCIAMAFVPVTLTTLAVGFVLFRFADIFKPWPISWLEKRVAGGLGIMLDDFLAGVMTNVILQFLIYWGLIAR